MKREVAVLESTVDVVVALDDAWRNPIDGRIGLEVSSGKAGDCAIVADERSRRPTESGIGALRQRSSVPSLPLRDEFIPAELPFANGHVLSPAHSPLNAKGRAASKEKLQLASR